jgi:choline dehydrogenase-like flavoprotein
VSFAAQVEGMEGLAFGNLFSPACLPVSELIARSPLPARTSIAVFRALMPALLVANVFLPGHLSDHRLVLRPDGSLEVRWQYSSALDAPFVARLRRRIAASMRRCGAWLLPGFKMSNPGSDMHYGGTVPMRASPAPHEATRDGEVKGLPGVFVVDGAALPSLPAKAHTLTIMANADRIGSAIGRAVAARREVS